MNSMLTTPNLVTVDLEASGLDHFDPAFQVWGATFTTDQDSTYWVEGEEDVRDTLVSYVEDGFIPVFHNGKYDVRVLRDHLRVTLVEWLDTMVMSYQVWPGYDKHDLDSVANRLRLRHTKLKLPDDWDWANPGDMLEAYALNDGVLQHKVLHGLVSKMEAMHVTDNFLQVDMPYLYEMIELEDHGLYVAPEARQRLQDELSSVMDSTYQTMADVRLLVPAKFDWDDKSKTYVPLPKTYKKGYYKRNGLVTYDHCQLTELNPNSARQVAWVMQEVYNWKPTQFTDKSCEPSTGVDHMSLFSNDFVDAFLEWQSASKIHNTFLEAFETHSDTEGYVHGRFNTTVTATGRLSSSKPNLQNIPTRGELGHRVRQLFTAPPNAVMWGGDLSLV